MMTPKEQLIHEQLVKLAERGWPGILDNPAVGYGLAGAGLGAGISTLRTLMRPQRERRGGVGRALSAGLLGGLTGGAAGAGLQLMGKKPPAIRDIPGIVTGKRVTKKPEGIGRSAAIGLAGAGVLSGLSGMERGRLMAQERSAGMRSPHALMQAWLPAEAKAKAKGGGKPAADAASMAAEAVKKKTNLLLKRIGEVGARDGSDAAKSVAARIIGNLSKSPTADQAVVSNIRRSLDQVGRARGLERIGASRFARLATNPRALLGVGAGIGVGNFAFRNLFNRSNTAD